MIHVNIFRLIYVVLDLVYVSRAEFSRDQGHFRECAEIEEILRLMLKLLNHFKMCFCFSAFFPPTCVCGLQK